MKERIMSSARRTLEIEIETLQNLGVGINQNFVDAVTLIHSSKGRVVVSGVGKSAIVAQKIVATFNSTGTPAIFMHAGDAVHGDLGIVQTGDIVLLLSKSGETSELKVLIPLLKNFGNKLIGMTANEKSFLATQSDFTIYTPVEYEADPNNLAPTASTTAQMVMGDAIAISLLELKGFSTEHFAQLHPGGALGKQLYWRVRDVFSQNTIPQVLPRTDLHSTILEMTTKRLGATAVVNDKNELIGIVTDGDLRRYLQKNNDLSHATAEMLMSENPKTIDADALAVDALKVMQQLSISQLIVLKDNKYAGMIHLHDLIREGIV